MLGIYKTSAQRAKSEKGKGQRVSYALLFALCPSLFSPSGVSMTFLDAYGDAASKVKGYDRREREQL
jgi:hypothetical protein